jgi:beta-lactam-binding protein with PASTA domain
VLAGLGLKVRVVRRASPLADPGTVLATEPGPGAQVPVGSQVTLLVASAPVGPTPTPTSPSPSRS